MPGYAYGIPASRCVSGSVLHGTKGSVCESCYALKGRYVFDNVQKAQFKRLFSIRHPQWVDAMAFNINKRECDYFRWHDSGDIQDLAHLEKIIAVARKCPSTIFWLPTREVGIIRSYKGWVPPNLVIRVSSAMVDGAPLASFSTTSTVVTKKENANCHASISHTNCGDCRNCWDPKVPNVAYLKH